VAITMLRIIKAYAKRFSLSTVPQTCSNTTALNYTTGVHAILTISALCVLCVFLFARFVTLLNSAMRILGPLLIECVERPQKKRRGRRDAEDAESNIILGPRLQCCRQRSTIRDRHALHRRRDAAARFDQYEFQRRVCPMTELAARGFSPAASY
jgi:hypothetical protein